MKSHDYQKFAKEYSQLGIKDTFYLGYRDIPKLVKEYVKGRKALDYGCGTGRSTRFLKQNGLDVIGVDVSKDQLEEAKRLDPEGDYLLMEDSEIPLDDSYVDLVLLSLVLMEVSSKEDMKVVFREVNRVLKSDGVVIITTDAENMYKYETTSFTYDFPENENIKSGDQVKLGFRGTSIVFNDYYWTEKDYDEVFSKTGFEIIEIHKPLATGDEPFEWITETDYPHFTIYVLRKDKK